MRALLYSGLAGVSLGAAASPASAAPAPAPAPAAARAAAVLARAATPAGVGFPEYRLGRPALTRVVDFRTGAFSFRVLPVGARVEVTGGEPRRDRAVRVLLADHRSGFLESAALGARSPGATRSAEALRDPAAARGYRPVRGLPPGLRYAFFYRGGARLHLVEVDLAAGDLEFEPVLTPPVSAGRRALEAVDELARGAGAAVAINGPFFIMAGRQKGTPLGGLAAAGEPLFEVEDPWLLGLRRSFLAVTDRKRFFMGETARPLSATLADPDAPEWRGRLAPGERVVSFVGGLGRMARPGDPGAWREGVDRQFAAKYYSRRTRRPQSVFGLKDDGARLLILVQEGRPHSERCFTVPELAHVMQDLGAGDVAFNDGGGSAELVVAGRPLVRTEAARGRRPNSVALVIRPRRAARPAPLRPRLG